MKVIIGSLFALLGLGACGGSGDGALLIGPEPITLTSTYVGVNGAEARPSGVGDVSIAFQAFENRTADLSINGLDQIVRFDETRARFYSDDDKTEVIPIRSFPGAPETEYLLMLVINQTDALGPRRLYGADGRGTPSGSLPPDGTSVYTGGVEATEAATGRLGHGELRLVVNHTNQRFQGRITGAHPDQPDDVILIDNAAFSDEQFDGPLSSANDAALTGVIRGRFFGPDGSEVAGTFHVSGTDNELAGLFAVTRTP